MEQNADRKSTVTIELHAALTRIIVAVMLGVVRGSASRQLVDLDSFFRC